MFVGFGHDQSWGVVRSGGQKVRLKMPKGSPCGNLTWERPPEALQTMSEDRRKKVHSVAGMMDILAGVSRKLLGGWNKKFQISDLLEVNPFHCLSCIGVWASEHSEHLSYAS